MSRVAAIQQPEHAPWIGFFNKMSRSDVFIYLDSVQFKKRYYENRNRIKSPHGTQWITVPVHTKGRYLQRITDVAIEATRSWITKYKRTLAHAYHKTPFWSDVQGIVWPALDSGFGNLVDLNLAIIETIRRYLGINVRTGRSSAISTREDTPGDRILAICEAVSADTYMSGPSGREYLDREAFRHRGVGLVFHDIDHPVYPQRFGSFVARLSTLDLIANCGPASGDIVRHASKTGVTR